MSPNLKEQTSETKTLKLAWTYLSGINTGATKLQMYSAMQTQLETTRIHIATSERPM
jgi:hypothetical protein